MPAQGPSKAGLRSRLLAGGVIPAHPLALDCHRRLDERSQRALTRYYLEAGAAGIAVGVHTTQFAIHEAKTGLLRPVLELAAETAAGCRQASGGAPIRIAGIVGRTPQAVCEAGIAASLGYDAGLLGFGAFRGCGTAEMIAHARAVAEVIPVMGFYLQPAVGGIDLGYRFWRELCEVEGLVAIKIAPFDRYRTLAVVRAVVDSGRAAEIALYTGNDDNIVGDLLTSYRNRRGSTRIVGGLLGHWAVWTRPACAYWSECAAARADSGGTVPAGLLRLNAEVTDANAALFDVQNQFAGCIAGIHEILRRQGLMQGSWCLDPSETLSPGQSAELDRVCEAYPHLTDDSFVEENLDRWRG